MKLAEPLTDEEYEKFIIGLDDHFKKVSILKKGGKHMAFDPAKIVVDEKAKQFAMLLGAAAEDVIDLDVSDFKYAPLAVEFVLWMIESGKIGAGKVATRLQEVALYIEKGFGLADDVKPEEPSLD